MFLKVNLLADPASPVALFQKYCFDCHSDGIEKGDLALDKLFKRPRQIPKKKTMWHKTWEVIEKEQMPPANKKKQPTDEEREIMMIAVEQAVYNINRNKEYPGKISLVRMSNQQYSNSIANLSGVKKDFAKMLPLDPPSAGFDNIGPSLSFSPILSEKYQLIALEVATEMFNQNTKHSEAKSKVSKLLALSGDGSNSKKVLEAIRWFSGQAFRRTPSNTELKELFKLYQLVRKNELHRSAMQKVIQSILISPNFIFRTELLGSDEIKGNIGRLNEFALASRLSFFLWNSAPDSQMLDAASKGNIRNNIDSLVRRIIRDDKFKQMVDSFGTYWLGVQYLENNIPDNKIFHFNKLLLPKMKEETSLFLKYMFTANKPINELFTSRETFVDSQLAKHYGLPFKGSGFKKVLTPDNHMRRGIITQPSVLIVSSDPNRTSIVKRGNWILENLLGMPPPPAPADVDADGLNKVAKEKQNLSLREQLKIHRENKKCASCHDMIDPLGFALENFNAIGKWRSTEKNKEIDVSTEWRGNRIDTFDDLCKMITGKYRDKLLKCLTEKMLTYALGRALQIEDRIAINKIVNKIKSPDSRLQDMIMAIVKSDSFQYRNLGK